MSWPLRFKKIDSHDRAHVWGRFGRRSRLVDVDCHDIIYIYMKYCWGCALNIHSSLPYSYLLFFSLWMSYLRVIISPGSARMNHCLQKTAALIAGVFISPFLSVICAREQSKMQVIWWIKIEDHLSLLTWLFMQCLDLKQNCSYWEKVFYIALNNK
jgi:hypothetical protein